MTSARVEMVIGTDSEPLDDPLLSKSAEEGKDGGGAAHEKRTGTQISPTAVQQHHAKMLEAISEKPLDVERICDQLDQVEYWALAEAHFPDQPSLLCGIFETLLLRMMAAIERTPVLIKCMTCATPMLRHADHRRAFARNADAYFKLVAAIMARYPNKEEIQVTATELVHAVASTSAQCLEELLLSDVISAVLCAMSRHGGVMAIQRGGCALFASIVALPRAKQERQEEEEEEKEEADGKETEQAREAKAAEEDKSAGDEYCPVSILLAQVGAVLDFVIAAYYKYPTASEIKASVAYCLYVMSQRPENLEQLGSTRAIPACFKIADTSQHCARTMHDAVATLGQLGSCMDGHQKEATIMLLQRVMARVTDVEVLSACCATCLALVASAEREEEEEAARAGASANNNGDTSKTMSLKVFASQNLVPLIGAALDHLGDEDELLRTTAGMCLRKLSINKWRM